MHFCKTYFQSIVYDHKFSVFTTTEDSLRLSDTSIQGGGRESNISADPGDSIDKEESKSAETVNGDYTQDLPQEHEQQVHEHEPMSTSSDNEESANPNEFEELGEDFETIHESPMHKGDKSTTPGDTSNSSRIIGGIKKFGRGVVSLFRSDSPYRLLHKKAITINLPHGAGPRVYCYLVSYKPTGDDKAAKQTPKPLISVTIKCSGKCHHKNTHLFVRFAGYNYHSIV